MAEVTKEYTVTEGNFVADDEGQKGASEKVKLTEKQAAPLKKAKIVE